MAGDEHELVTATHGQIAAVFSALASFLTALTMRLTGKARPPGESKEQREKRLELERQLADAEAHLLELRFQGLRNELIALVNAVGARVDNLQHENGKQGGELETLKKDINNLWREHRAEAGREK